jgi:uncharacterized membrane protein
MIQRIQSLYLLLAVLLSSGLLYVSHLTEYAMSLESFFSVNYGFYLIPFLTLITLLFFKKRKIQGVLILLIILFTFFPIVLYVQEIYNGVQTSVLYATVSIYLLNIIFLLLARKGIIKDEKLVRSIDRIR